MTSKGAELQPTGTRAIPEIHWNGGLVYNCAKHGWIPYERAPVAPGAFQRQRIWNRWFGYFLLNACVLRGHPTMVQIRPLVLQVSVWLRERMPHNIITIAVVVIVRYSCVFAGGRSHAVTRLISFFCWPAMENHLEGDPYASDQPPDFSILKDLLFPAYLEPECGTENAAEGKVSSKRQCNTVAVDCKIDRITNAKPRTRVCVNCSTGTSNRADPDSGDGAPTCHHPSGLLALSLARFVTFCVSIFWMFPTLR